MFILSNKCTSLHYQCPWISYQAVQKCRKINLYIILLTKVPGQNHVAHYWIAFYFEGSSPNSRAIWVSWVKVSLYQRTRHIFHFYTSQCPPLTAAYWADLGKVGHVSVQRFVCHTSFLCVSVVFHNSSPRASNLMYEWVCHHNLLHLTAGTIFWPSFWFDICRGTQ